MAEENVSFCAKYKEWLVIKKMGIDETTTPQEVAGTLASINATLVRKSFDFLKINTSIIDEYSSSLVKGKRKAWGNIGEIFSSLKPAEISTKLKEACPEEKLLPVAEAYFLRSLLSAMGFELQPTTEMLSHIYPELKIAKPRGNFGKQKKA